MEFNLDTRVHLLLHCLNGLFLSEAEVEVVFTNTLSLQDYREVICNGQALDYFSKHPHWVQESEKILERSQREGIRWCHRQMDEYPQMWRELSVAPLIFSYKGEPSWRTLPQLAVVGSRTPMDHSRIWMQRELGEFLKNNEVGVVSGAARGIDQWAHRLALDFDRPTVCVLPSGIANPYPFHNEKFWERVVGEGGCLLSTFALDEPIRKAAFHTRNRWITGMSKICFVVEANRRSGSALTARLALEEGKDICTLPVFPHSDQGLANLDLISEGATLLRNHVDLQVLWDRSRPLGLESANRKQEENPVHQPQSH